MTHQDRTRLADRTRRIETVLATLRRYSDPHDRQRRRGRRVKRPASHGPVSPRS